MADSTQIDSKDFNKTNKIVHLLTTAPEMKRTAPGSLTPSNTPTKSKGQTKQTSR